MAAKTYCQACCRVLHIPEASLERKVRCRCGNTFRAEKPLWLKMEEDREEAFRKRGLAHLRRIDRKGMGRPLLRRRIFGATLGLTLLLLCLGLYLEEVYLRPAPRPMQPIPVRLAFAVIDPESEDAGTSLQDPQRPKGLPGEGPPAERPGKNDTIATPESVASSASERGDDRDGDRRSGKWRLVPEEAKRLWDLEGLLSPRKEGRTDPDDLQGVGSPPEGSPARPTDPEEVTREDALAQRGREAERAALAAIAQNASGGGTSFFGSPVPLEGRGIIFVIDCSASMILQVSPPRDAPVPARKWSKLDLAKWELKKAIAMLPEEVEFNVIFFDDCLLRWRYRAHPAKPSTKRDAYDWIDTIRPNGQTNVSEAVGAALKAEGRNTVVLLSDGKPNVIDCKTLVEAPPRIHEEKIRQLNRELEPILCFGLSEDVESETFLKNVAAMSGGRYTPISTKRF